MQVTILEICLLVALFICLIIHLYYVLGVHLKLSKYKVSELPEATKQPLSVIVCARNEAENLAKYLDSLLTQDYPNYEVVVVNDRSWDDTRDLLEEFEQKYSNLKTVYVADGQKFIAGKKFAVTMGIKAAKNEWLVFTDADCMPASKNWLRGMQPPADGDVSILLGYSPYFKRGGLLNALIRFETFFTAVNYLSYAIKGNPYMGVGRNMAYKKSLFFANKGFAAHMHIPSGDDDLFVNANATAQNTTIQIHKDTHVWSEPNTSFFGYLKQKKRHFGAGKMYKKEHQIMLSLQIAIQFAFYVLLVAAALLPNTQYVAAGIFLFSIIVRCFVYPRLLVKLNYAGLSWWFPLLDIILMVFLVFNAILSIFVKKVQWK